MPDLVLAPSPGGIALLPDAGPLIALAYADALDILFKPGWTVTLVGRVLHEVTRNPTPTSSKLTAWAAGARIPVLPTKALERFRQAEAAGATPKRSDLGELAIQEIMNDFALQAPPKSGVFLFEDHKVARASFLVPDSCRKISTRAFLTFLQHKGWIASASEIERNRRRREIGEAHQRDGLRI